MLHNDAQMRAAWFNEVEAPNADKMFAYGRIP
jgi:hypothetical protein